MLQNSGVFSHQLQVEQLKSHEKNIDWVFQSTIFSVGFLNSDRISKTHHQP